MRIIFVWTGVAGYMADCWRVLASRPDISLKIVIQERRRHRNTAHDTQRVLRGLDAEVVYDDEPLPKQRWREMLRSFSPDCLFIVGWHAATSRFFATCGEVRSIPKVLVFDLPFQWTLKKLIAPVVLFPYLRLFKAAFVPGAAAQRYARWLGFSSQTLGEEKDGGGRPSFSGLFSVDVESYRHIRRDSSYPRRFLYVGRFVPEKRLDRLAAAYRRYRSLVRDPWPLDCFGMGPRETLLQQVEGVNVNGFITPEEMRTCYANHGAFLLASAFDPWPLVLAEASAAGLPVVCTEACGNVREAVGANGVVCPSGDVEAFARAMERLHGMSDAALFDMGAAGLNSVSCYSCGAWAERVERIVNVLTEGR